MIREVTSIQDDLFVALLFDIIIKTSTLQPRYSFQHAFTHCIKCFQLDVSCFPGFDSHIAIFPAPQIRLFHLSGTCWRCSRCMRNRAVSTFIQLVQSSTGVVNLHAHPRATTVVATPLALNSSVTAFSFRVWTHSMCFRNTTLELLGELLMLV